MPYALGRLVEHDPRSLAFKVVPTGEIRSARWERLAPVFDQGDLGSCTGNAAAGVLGSEPFVTPGDATLPSINEDFAVNLYRAATRLDDFPGQYEPDDTGSSGLAVAKVCKAIGAVSGYTHITSLAAAHTAIQTGPFIVGTNWYEAMFEPDGAGLVTPAGQVAGGHEYECIGYDAVLGRWEFVNSWGPSWGAEGHFFYTDAVMAKLLTEDGDATVFVPPEQPAPSPVIDVPNADFQLLDTWAAARHTGSNRKAAQAWQRVRAGM